MGTVVDATIPAGQFALAETFDAVADVTFEALRVAAHGPSEAIPFLRASSSRLDRLDAALRADRTTAAVTYLSRYDDRALYRIDWCAGTRDIVGVIVEADGTVLDARGNSNQWELRILFPGQTSVSATYDNWRDRGIDPLIRRVNDTADVVDYGGVDLSPCQYETLVGAYRMGYYEVPRGITLDDLATDFDVSHQALSERFRRGHRTLVETTLCQSPTSVGYRP